MRSPPLRAADAVRGRAVAAAGHAVEHVAEVAHQRARLRRDVDPAAGPAHLETAALVLAEDGEQAVVGVLADSPVAVVPSAVGASSG